MNWIRDTKPHSRPSATVRRPAARAPTSLVLERLEGRCLLAGIFQSPVRELGNHQPEPPWHVSLPVTALVSQPHSVAHQRLNPSNGKQASWNEYPAVIVRQRSQISNSSAPSSASQLRGAAEVQQQSLSTVQTRTVLILVTFTPLQQPARMVVEPARTQLGSPITLSVSSLTGGTFEPKPSSGLSLRANPSTAMSAAPSGSDSTESKLAGQIAPAGAKANSTPSASDVNALDSTAGIFPADKTSPLQVLDSGRWSVRPSYRSKVDSNLEIDSASQIDDALLQLFPNSADRRNSRRGVDQWDLWQLDMGGLRELRQSLRADTDRATETKTDEVLASWFGSHHGLIDLDNQSVNSPLSQPAAELPVYVKLDSAAGECRDIHLFGVTVNSAKLPARALVAILDAAEGSPQTTAASDERATSITTPANRLTYASVALLTVTAFVARRKSLNPRRLCCINPRSN